jgi:hypothetical protein
MIAHMATVPSDLRHNFAATQQQPLFAALRTVIFAQTLVSS